MRLLPVSLLACIVVLGAGVVGQEPATEGYRSELDAARRDARQGKRASARSKLEAVLSAVEEEPEGDRPSAKEQAEALEGLAWLQRETGDYEGAQAKLGEARKVFDRVEQDALAARLEALRGGYEPALALVRKARGRAPERTPLGLELAWLEADLLATLGQREAAGRVLGAVEELGKAQPLTDPEAKLWYAKALIGLGGGDRLYEASQLLIEATKADPLLAEAYVTHGRLLYDVYREAAGRPSGESELKRVLQQCGEQESALVELYRTRKDNFLLDAAKTDDFLRRALALNKRSVPALRARASSMVDDRRFESARTLLLEALEINPRDKETLAELVAVSNLLYRSEDETSYRDRCLKIDPGYAHVDTVLGEHLIALYRFADALPVLKRAKEKDPGDTRTLLALGRALIYAGHGAEAARELERTKEIQRGFLNPWRENQLFLQKRLDEAYERVEVGNFAFSLHPSEKGVLLPYLSREYEAARARLGTKYGTFPDCKVHVENFERFGDFSVRTIGFTGFGALGACFGCFITSVSAAAPELRQQFSWKVTAWHEFAHVLHLQLSKARIPRWLTEGAAVYEEIGLDASFDRRMERELHSALKNDSIIPLSELNTLFRTPRILFGYYQGGLVTRHIAKEWGFDKVVAIIKAYGEDKSTEQIFRQVLGLDPEEYDAKFRAFVERMVGSYRLVPQIEEETMNRLLERLLEKPDDVEARLLLAWGFVQRGNEVDAGQQLAALRRLDAENGGAYLLRAKLQAQRKDLAEARRLLQLGFEKGGDDFDSRLTYARILEEAGRTDDAIAQYDAAIRCWPTCAESGADSPFLNKVRLLRKKGDQAAAADVLAEYVRYNGKDYAANVLLAKHYRDKGDLDAELAHLERARDIDPFDRALHERLAAIYVLRSRPDEAAFVLRVCLEIRADKDRSKRVSPEEAAVLGDEGPKGPPEDEAVWEGRMRVLLAEALRASGQLEPAAAEAKKALRAREALPKEWVERAEAIGR